MTETRRVRMTKALLQQALLELLETRALGKISVTELCAAADVNRSTFYVYYESIPQLLLEIENNALNQIPIAPDTPTPAAHDRFLEMLTEFFDYVQHNDRLFRILLLQWGSSNFSRRLVDAVLDKYHQKSIIANTLAAHYWYVYCVNGVVGLLREWIEQGFPISSRAFSDMILQMSLQANEIRP